MSLFDDASLVYIPTGYKPTKNYSGKPSTGGADMTFSRASGATRVNSRGLVEKVRTNLILQSNTFDTTWTATSATLTSGQTGYDGTSDAWLLEATATSSSLRQNYSAPGVFCFSAYAKAGSTDWIRLRFDNTSTADVNVWFNLSDGSIGASNGIAPYTENIGDGWWRLVVQANTSDLNNLRILTAASDGANPALGDYVYIQDAQLEQGLVATNYIETTSAAVSVGPVNDEPRLTYNPVNPTAPSLLMEPQRTNLALYSEQFDNAAWSQTRGTITANAIASPDGYTNADLWAQNTGETTAAALLQNISVTSGTAYSLSVFAKKQNKNFLGIRANSVSSIPSYFDLENGTLGDINPLHTAKIEDYGNGWYRCSISYTTNSTIAGHIFYPTDGSSLTVTDSGGIYLFGAMHEAGSYGTSYIPTNGTSVTRVADASLKTGISSLIGQTEGTLFFEIQDTEHFVSYFGVDNVSTGTRILVYGIDDQKVYAQVRNGGTIVFSASSAVISGRAKAAVSFNASGSVFYVNGTQVGSGSGTTYTNLSKFTLNHSSQVGSSLNKALLFTTRLDNATLATLTSL